MLDSGSQSIKLDLKVGFPGSPLICVLFTGCENSWYKPSVYIVHVYGTTVTDVIWRRKGGTLTTDWFRVRKGNTIKTLWLVIKTERDRTQNGMIMLPQLYSHLIEFKSHLLQKHQNVSAVGKRVNIQLLSDASAADDLWHCCSKRRNCS